MKVPAVTLPMSAPDQVRPAPAPVAKPTVTVPDVWVTEQTTNPASSSKPDPRFGRSPSALLNQNSDALKRAIDRAGDAYFPEVVIGGGEAGAAYANAKTDADPGAQVLVLTDGPTKLPPNGKAAVMTKVTVKSIDEGADGIFTLHLSDGRDIRTARVINTSMDSGGNGDIYLASNPADAEELARNLGRQDAGKPRASTPAWKSWVQSPATMTAQSVSVGGAAK